MSTEHPHEFVALTCPYCGAMKYLWLERVSQPQVILCDQEDGPGCDRYFAVRLQMVPKVQYYTVDSVITS